MGRFRSALILLLLLIFLPGCSRHRESGDVVYGGWNDLFVIDMSSGRIIEKVPIGAQINGLELAEDGRLFLATTRGLLVVDTSIMEVVHTVPLGILDSVRYAGARDQVYVLHHPGDRPDMSNGPHKILKLSGADYSHLGDFYLEPWTYEIFLDPSGENIYVTHMAGREVMKIPTDDFEDSEKVWFGEGGNWEGRMVLLRHITFSGDGSNFYVLEQGESNPTCVWHYFPDTGEKKKTCLDEKAKIQGMVTSPDGSRIYANGLTELVIMDSNGEEISRTDLGVKHRWITLNGNADMIYLSADTGEDSGQITCVDTQGNLVREVKVPTPLNVIAVRDNLVENSENQTARAGS
jgi:DNA-binding beta-propeller fold protein YncE